MTVRVKICGLTRRRDVEAAANAGADYLGFVFANSPRRVTIEQARRLADAAPQGPGRVALFMDQDAAYVREVLAAVEFELIQFHGREANDWCRSFARPFVKAVGVRNTDVARSLRAYPDAAGILFDSHAAGESGGTGQAFDWSLLPPGHGKTWLAGGLCPENVAEAIERVRPFAVDVSSGVEVAPGIKDHDRVRAFISAARTARKPTRED